MQPPIYPVLPDVRHTNYVISASRRRPLHSSQRHSPSSAAPQSSQKKPQPSPPAAALQLTPLQHPSPSLTVPSGYSTHDGLPRNRPRTRRSNTPPAYCFAAVAAKRATRRRPSETPAGSRISRPRFAPSRRRKSNKQYGGSSGRSVAFITMANSAERGLEASVGSVLLRPRDCLAFSETMSRARNNIHRELCRTCPLPRTWKAALLGTGD